MPFIQFEKIQIGPIFIYVWGIFLALAVLVSLIYSLKLAQKKGFDEKLIADVYVWLIVGLIVGARTGYILLYFDYYVKNPLSVLKIWQGGMTFHGGLIGIILAGLALVKIKKFDWKTFLRGADIIALSAPLAIAVGRIGCSLINDHQGTKTFLPWGIIWPDGSVRHPVAEYLIIANIVIFLILRDKPGLSQKEGEVFFRFLFLYSLMRFALDFTRIEPRFFYLSTAQWLSLIVISSIIIKRLLKGRFCKQVI